MPQVDNRKATAATPWPVPTMLLVNGAAHCVWTGDTPPEQIRLASYAYHRQMGFFAHAALACMRKDVENRRVRFPNFYTQITPQKDGGYWVETPDKFGLRLVGFADEVNGNIRHRGWYLDEFQDETVRGVVYRIPAKNGESRFVAGVADPWNDGPALIESEIFDSEIDAAYRADGCAEIFAEREREARETEDIGGEND